MKTPILLTLSLVLVAFGAIQPVQAVTAVENLGKTIIENGTITFSNEPDPVVAVCNDTATILQADWDLHEDRVFIGPQVRRAEFGMSVFSGTTQATTEPTHGETMTTPVDVESTPETALTFTLPPGLPGDAYSVTLFGRFWNNFPGSFDREDSLAVTIGYVDCEAIDMLAECMSTSDETMMDSSDAGFYPGWQNGESNWVIYLEENVPCISKGLSVPLWADLGSLRKDVYTKEWTKDTPCTHNYDAIGWDYYWFDISVTFALEDTEWRGQLPFNLGRSDIEFDLPDDSVTYGGREEFGSGMTDIEDELHCKEAYWQRRAQYEADGIAWVNARLDDLVIPCKGQITMLNDLVTTGLLEGSCSARINIISRAYEFEGVFPLQTVGGSQVSLIGRGHSLLSSP